MANRFEMQLVRDHESRHIRRAEQFLGVFQLHVVDILRDRAIGVLFEKAGELGIAIRQGTLQFLQFFVRELRIVQISNERCKLVRHGKRRLPLV